jgi:hypothetical protein
MMLEHLVANYDMKLDSANCTRPLDPSVGAHITQYRGKGLVYEMV